MRKLLYIVLTSSIIVGFWECQKSLSPEDMQFTARIKADSTLYLLVNDTFKIKVTPAEAIVSFSVNVDNTYKDPKNGVITVSNEGIIKALEPGKGSVSIKNNSGNITFNIIVAELPLKIQLKDSSLLIKTGKSVQLALADVFDQYESKCFGGLKWEVSDKTVASVSDMGNFTALKEGTTKVRISLKNYPALYAECTVQIANIIVHIVGESLNESNYLKPCYWKNNQKIETGLETLAYMAQSINYSNNNINIVGTTYDGKKAYNLKSGVFTIFNESGAAARGITTIGEDVYTTGHYTYSGIITVALWKNNVLSPILENTEITYVSMGRDITSSGGDTYICGYYKNSNDKQVACYWKNKQRIDLSDGSSNTIANSIFVDGTDVYVVGHYTTSVNGYINTVACYWRNGVKTDLSSFASEANSIYVSKGNVYISGNYSIIVNKIIACYWKNGEKTDLNSGNGALWSNSFCIKVADDNIFITGLYYNSSNNPIGCYWKNGIRIELPPVKFDNQTYTCSKVNSLAIE